MSLQDKILGCIYGGAVGDALGYPVEFISAERIFSRYGECGITEYSLTDGVAQISDDTQMTLFTLEGLLRAEDLYSHPTADNYVTEVYGSYLDWLYTQEHSFSKPSDAKRSELLKHRELYDRRAPGNTCLSALDSGFCGSFELKLNNSKGCGGVMRTAPVAALFATKEHNPAESDILAARIAAITHSHPLGYIPAAFLNRLLLAVFRGETLTAAVTEARSAVLAEFSSKDCEYFDRLIDLALELAEDAELDDDLDGIVRIGEGWVAEETVAIAVFCALRHSNDFEAAVIASVNHSGDSDSTGAVTGNIMGALLGYRGIPPKFTEKTELSDLILSLTKRIF